MEGIISLYDIFAQHRNWYDYKEEELTGEVWMQIKQEMAQASADFAIRLTQLGERWRNAVEKNIEKLHTTASVPAVSNKARCERYRDALEEFSNCVRLALENVFTKSELNDLHPLTRYWLGTRELRTMVVHTELSKEEAGDVYKNELQSFPVRRMFREIPFLGRYTVFGYKGKAGDEASTPTTPQQSPKDGAEGQQPTKDFSKKEPKQKGRPQKEFDDFFIMAEDVDKIKPIIRKLIDGKIGRDAVRIIVACCKGGWITEPTAVSIEREFGISQSGLKEHLRCHFKESHFPSFGKPKFSPFTDEELTPIINSIKTSLQQP